MASTVFPTLCFDAVVNFITTSICPEISLDVGAITESDVSLMLFIFDRRHYPMPSNYLFPVPVIVNHLDNNYFPTWRLLCVHVPGSLVFLPTDNGGTSGALTSDAVAVCV